MTTRNESLDALRGFAILTMILSGAIAYGNVLLAWMFHAQVPPPAHTFNPAIPGITWVDLVFPFFLFSMGAAIPLALRKHLEAGKGFTAIFALAGKRFLLLAFFALFTQHMKAWVIAEQPGTKEQALSLLAFVLLFFQFYEYKGLQHKRLFTSLRLLSFAAGLFLLWQLPFWGGKGFDFYKSDIIILVLANMALFGTLIYYVTRHQPGWRLAVLPLVMAVFLAGKEPGDSWVKAVFAFDHIGSLRLDWLYKFYFLKYLFLIIPGTLAGEWLAKPPAGDEPVLGKRGEDGLAWISFFLILWNLYGLFTRQLLLNAGGSLLLCGAALYLTRPGQAPLNLRRLVQAGTFCLFLGLLLEPYEGGIKKDPSTYSYYGVTGGLAFFSLVLFTVMAKRKIAAPFARMLASNGKNPMVAYVAGNLLLLPLLRITELYSYWDGLRQNAFLGFLKGLLFTALVSLVTVFFVKRRWFWKT